MILRFWIVGFKFRFYQNVAIMLPISLQNKKYLQISIFNMILNNNYCMGLYSISGIISIVVFEYGPIRLSQDSRWQTALYIVGVETLNMYMMFSNTPFWIWWVVLEFPCRNIIIGISWFCSYIYIYSSYLYCFARIILTWYYYLKSVFLR